MRKQILYKILGWTGIALFAVIYSVELLPHHGPPVTVSWIRETFGQAGLIAINMAIVLAFLALLPYRRPTRHIWKSRGAFIAFVIALMTEMFGWPLLLFLLAPAVEIPTITPEYFQSIGHWPAAVGTALSLLGIALIAVGWTQIHGAQGLIMTGLYRTMRHPQYTGIFLFTLGWIIHWPAVITLILWPVLTSAYVWLSLQEEKQAKDEFGELYIDYAKRTKRFIPLII